MVAQDASGVVFRALDAETGLPVAVRRFFPFGPNGGGLSEKEQADYTLALDRLAGISHPAMRSIIAGGCDPVDGMPFIATEWLEGQPLQVYLEQTPLKSSQAIHLLMMAVEVCGQISQVLGEEAVWIETDVQTIIIGGDDEGRGVTFWISPLKWLGKGGGERGLRSLAGLTEDLMGWRGKMIHDHEGGGLGAVLKWLRQVPPQTQLRQVREKLAATANSPSPAPSRRLVRPPVRATAPVRKKAPSKIPFVVGGILSLAVLSVGGWSLMKWNNARLKTMSRSVTSANPAGEIPATSEIPSVVASSSGERPSIANPLSTSKPPKKTAEQIRSEAEEFGKSLRDAEQAKAGKITAVAARNGIHYLEDSELLMDRMGDEVILEGTLDAVKSSSSGKTIYLIFSGGKARGGVEVARAEGGLAESALGGLIGEKLQIKGMVRGDGFGKSKTPVVMVETRTAIQVIP